MSDAPPPPSPAPASVRSAVALIAAVAGLITAIAGLVTAIAALRKQPEEPAARESYVVVQEAIKGLAAENDEFRNDYFDLRTAFEDYVRAKEGPANVETVPASSDAQAPPVRIQVRRTPTPAPVATSTRPLPVPSVAVTPATPATSPPVEPPSEVVIPWTSSRKKAASRANLPSFDAIEAKAKK